MKNFNSQGWTTSFKPVLGLPRATDFIYSSAEHYLHKKSVIEEVTLIDNPDEDLFKSWSIVV